MKFFKFFAIAVIITSLQSCEDFLEVDLPKSRMVKQTVFKSDGTALSAVAGMYHQMASSNFAAGGTFSITLLSGTSSDELVNYYLNSISNVEFYENELLPENTLNYGIWSSIYQTIYNANSILEGLSGSNAVSQELKIQLEGEARFVRAFCYFYLVNLYRDVPLILTTDYETNKRASRTPSDQVYERIVADLLKAKELLSSTYPSADRVRPNKSVASALLARVYLYMKRWQDAETQASIVIANTTTYDLVEQLDDAFLSTSKEAIWQLLQPQFPTRTNEANLFILASAPGFGSPVALRDELVDNFETGDLRRTHWIGTYVGTTGTYYYPWKYKVKSGMTTTRIEYSVAIRLAEMHLIRAEARAQQDKLTEAIADLNEVRGRAQAQLIDPNDPLIDQDYVLALVDQERKLELFGEWGHRWLDLKRRGIADDVMLAVKDDWEDTDVLYPIPQQDILNNPNLKPQNPGY